MIYLFLYLASIIDNIKSDLVFIPLILVLIAICSIPILGLLLEEKFFDYAKKYKNVIINFFLICLILMFSANFIPTKGTLYQMAAVYCGKELNKTVQIDKKLQKVSELIDLQLDKNIKELKNVRNN